MMAPQTSVQILGHSTNYVPLAPQTRSPWRHKLCSKSGPLCKRCTPGATNCVPRAPQTVSSELATPQTRSPGATNYVSRPGHYTNQVPLAPQLISPRHHKQCPKSRPLYKLCAPGATNYAPLAPPTMTKELAAVHDFARAPQTMSPPAP